MRQLLPELLAAIAARGDDDAAVVVEMTFVYIAEAHAGDEWPVGNQFRTDTDSIHWPPNVERQPTTVDERCTLARALAQRFAFPPTVRVMVDSPVSVSMKTSAGVDVAIGADGFSTLFAAWPVRFFVVDDASRRLVYIASPQHASFDLAPILATLDT